MLNKVYIPNKYIGESDSFDISNQCLLTIYKSKIHIQAIKDSLDVSKEIVDETIERLDYHREWIINLRSLVMLTDYSTKH